MNFVSLFCIIWNQTLYMFKSNLQLVQNLSYGLEESNIIGSHHNMSLLKVDTYQLYLCALASLTVSKCQTACFYLNDSDDCYRVWKSYSDVIVKAGGGSFSIACHSHFFTWIILLDWKLTQLRNIKILLISAPLWCFTIRPHADSSRGAADVNNWSFFMQ